MTGGCGINYYSHGTSKSNKPLLTIEAVAGSEFALKQIISEFLRDKEKTVQIDFSDKKRKRSLNANSYFWSLLDKSAEKLNANRDELYRKYIREYGVILDVTVKNDEVPELRQKWESNNKDSKGWFSEIMWSGDDKSDVRLYAGSSSYTTKQMSRLINAVVEDCRELGIETLTPAEIAGLCDRWKPKGK